MLVGLLGPERLTKAGVGSPCWTNESSTYLGSIGDRAGSDGPIPLSQRATLPTAVPSTIMTTRRSHESPFRLFQNFAGISTTQQTATVRNMTRPTSLQSWTRASAAYSVASSAAKTADKASEPASSAI